MYEIETAVDEARAVHHHGEGWFALFRKDPLVARSRQQMFRMEQLEDVVGAIGSDADTYISQGSFVRRSRKANALGQIGCAFVDVDCYNLGIVPDEHLVRDIMLEAAEVGLPLPSYVAYSGRGIYLKWLFHRPVPAAQLHRWQALQSVLVPLYKSIGADASVRDAARVLRVMGSTNSATGQRVYVLWNGGTRHDFDELCAAAAAVDIEPLQLDSALQASTIERRIRKLTLLDPTTEKQREEQNRASIAHMNDFATKREPFMLQGISKQSLNWRRFIDLRDLVIMRGGLKRGSRDVTLFWMGVFLAHSGIVTAENFAEEMADLADAFPGADFRPMSDGSLGTLLARIRQHGRGERVRFRGTSYSPIYTPTNTHLINLFEIELSEQRGLCTVIGEEEKRRRSDLKCAGRSERRERRIEWRTQACSLAAEAWARGCKPSASEIAAEVGVHKSQVSRLLAGRLRFAAPTPPTARRRRTASDRTPEQAAQQTAGQMPERSTAAAPIDTKAAAVNSRQSANPFAALSRPKRPPGPTRELDDPGTRSSHIHATSSAHRIANEPVDPVVGPMHPTVAVFSVSKEGEGFKGVVPHQGIPGEVVSDSGSSMAGGPAMDSPQTGGPRTGLPPGRQAGAGAGFASLVRRTKGVRTGQPAPAVPQASPEEQCDALELAREMRAEVCRQTQMAHRELNAARERALELAKAEHEQTILRMRQRIEAIRQGVFGRQDDPSHDSANPANEQHPRSTP